MKKILLKRITTFALAILLFTLIIAPLCAQTNSSVAETALTQAEGNLATDTFVLIKASSLSVDDEFMQYEPQTYEEREFKSQLTEVIQNGIHDFWHSKYEPSFNEDHSNICYEAGKIPATGKNPDWWEKIAKDFAPERGSRLGTKSEYVAFLGCLIKDLTANGWTQEKAWNEVCGFSFKQRGYWSCLMLGELNTTGSNEVGGFYDLTNTSKLLTGTNNFWLAGSSYFGYGTADPLTLLTNLTIHPCDSQYYSGWLVLEQ